ncbi:TPA: helix-turn-helix transcriptional regulator [Staphylococcus aureus]|nr:helix-turn-helix transcriptional regulator [Staphylococcus pseudintermedius]HDZ9991134.1 helix-turn-helix transcriptional regulator [Staphylococcus aureus]HEA0030415.1 helix-turn-helix transcriptional regulator [Staphylococcus aureus]HEA0052024.1 helix-turn-helix transcriptional regulator [Staphylococcus aureus]HEA0065412.1 helix-turn-helix transcriptional regulator [Staphylococcus aureus]
MNNEHKFIENLGEILKQLREEKRIKQKVVANGIGVTSSYLNRIENNKSNTIQLKLLIKLLAYYDMTLFEFIEKHKELTDHL